jgi:hypothetical protein
MLTLVIPHYDPNMRLHHGDPLLWMLCSELLLRAREGSLPAASVERLLPHLLRWVKRYDVCSEWNHGTIVHFLCGTGKMESSSGDWVYRMTEALLQDGCICNSKSDATNPLLIHLCKFKFTSARTHLLLIRAGANLFARTPSAGFACWNQNFHQSASVIAQLNSYGVLARLDHAAVDAGKCTVFHRALEFLQEKPNDSTAQRVFRILAELELSPGAVLPCENGYDFGA